MEDEDRIGDDELQDDEEETDLAPIAGDTWVSPVSFNAESMSRLIRQILDEFEYDFIRGHSEKAYTSVKVIVPMPKFANVYRFSVVEPSRFDIDLYDTKPTHGGWMYYIEVRGVNEETTEDVRRILARIVEKSPRPPWRFTVGQRLQCGYFQPEFYRSRKAWAGMGFDVKKK